MKFLDYKNQIAAATTAAELHELRGTAEFDPQLTASERGRVAEAVGKRFAQLNAEAIGHQKPRWRQAAARQ